MAYRAPVEEIAFTLRHVAGLGDAMAAGAVGDLSDDLVDAVLSEAGRFATDVVAPLDAVGDRVGACFEGGAVTMPPGWRQAYRAWSEAGWNGLVADPAHGGQGLPVALGAATAEMWNAGALAFGLGPTLTIAAAEAVAAHAAPELKRLYLDKLVSGEWMGTMNLTEPQAGSDLAALTTRAEPAADGSYRLFGQKIFITFGEHDLTENIVHLVLARLPDAPAGTRGLSLFLAPKVLVGDDGSLGRRNDVVCRSIEHKLGIHASPTCVMGYGDGGEGAVAFLVGEPHQGLKCMFTMMNNARLQVGIEGVAIAERATQQALAFAQERRQGRSPRWAGGGMSPIVEHPDVMRMLLTMRALTRAARSIAYACAVAIDRARSAAGDDQRHWQERANLLTPVAKAFSTDIGVDVASLGIQVHGGMGYIEETGAARHLRDARIAPIYEGTNGIQAIDLVVRKLPQSGGAAVRGYIAELRAIAERARGENRPDLGDAARRLSLALDDLTSATEWLLAAQTDGRGEAALAGATPYLRLFGLAAGGTYLVSAALAAGDAAGRPGRALVARHFVEAHQPETASLRAVVEGGGGAVLAATAELLGG
jgi:acyl-CoA dehydrogenase